MLIVLVLLSGSSCDTYVYDAQMDGMWKEVGDTEETFHIYINGNQWTRYTYRELDECFDTVSFDEVLTRKLAVMDTTAFTLCQENNIPIIVFDVNQIGNLRRIVQGEAIGTLVERL